MINEFEFLILDLEFINIHLHCIVIRLFSLQFLCQCFNLFGEQFVLRTNCLACRAIGLYFKKR